MALPDFSLYKYIMFVDASGDDGYKFKDTSSEGSSYSFVVSCFVTSPQELEHNKKILLNMKRAIFVKPEQEIKSTALKRHRNADAVYEEMKNLHGFSYSLIADKRLLQKVPEEKKSGYEFLSVIAKNDLSGITHVFPYISLHNSNLLNEEDKVLVVIDNMKKREMDSIKKILSGAPQKQIDLTFRDSKDKNFSLIQIADIFAGTIRTYYEDCLPIKEHNRFCKICSSAIFRKKPGKILRKCKDKKIGRLYFPYLSNNRFNIVINFHKTRIPNNNGFVRTFIILPISQLLYFSYIECYFFKHSFGK